jgi:hypothetical protein
MLSRRDSARYNKPRFENLNDVAALVYRPTEKHYRATIGSRARRRNFNDFALDMEYISRTGWRWPAQSAVRHEDRRDIGGLTGSWLQLRCALESWSCLPPQV